MADAQITRATGGSLGANAPTTNLNVGINYTNPQAPLDVKSEIRVTSAGGTNWLSFSTPGAFHTISSTNNLGLVANNNAQINFTLGGSVRTTMLSNGNVGIATSNATAKLTVNGNCLIGDPATVTLPGTYKLFVQGGILTEKVKIALVGTADWADFVFADNYRLRPLSEVESFIQANKHLPEVPSAQALVDDGGVDVQSMMAKQMQKIEELTLYLIAQNKKIEALEAQVNAIPK